jgi:hypothetical protein
LEHPWLTVLIGELIVFGGVIGWVFAGCVHFTGAYPISPMFVIDCEGK